MEVGEEGWHLISVGRIMGHTVAVAILKGHKHKSWGRELAQESA